MIGIFMKGCNTLPNYRCEVVLACGYVELSKGAKESLSMFDVRSWTGRWHRWVFEDDIADRSHLDRLWID